MEFKNIENPKKLVYCHFCEREITRITYFLNDESKKEICVSCFMKGRESESHKKTDPYRIIERLDKDFLENEWSCYDELSFLEAIELYGYGNWSDISTHLPSKTSRQIERHFKYCYYQHLNTETGFDARKKIEEEEMTEFKPLIDKKNEQLAKMIEITTKESIKNNIGSGKTNIYGDIIGFMPLRKEFDYEYDNDAEQLLAEMEFTEEDSENDRKIKFSVLEIYNRKLKEREKRKEFVIERNKLDIKAIFEDD